MTLLTPKILQLIGRGAVVLLTSPILLNLPTNGSAECLGDIILNLMKNSVK